MVAQDTSRFAIKTPQVDATPVEIVRPAETVKMPHRKCDYELSEIRITVQNVGKCTTSGFVCFEKRDVVIRLAAVEKKKKMTETDLKEIMHRER